MGLRLGLGLGLGWGWGMLGSESGINNSPGFSKGVMLIVELERACSETGVWGSGADGWEGKRSKGNGSQEMRREGKARQGQGKD